jgi:hypothetical protein
MRASSSRTPALRLIFVTLVLLVLALRAFQADATAARMA